MAVHGSPAAVIQPVPRDLIVRGDVVVVGGLPIAPAFDDAGAVPAAVDLQEQPHGVLDGTVPRGRHHVWPRRALVELDVNAGAAPELHFRDRRGRRPAADIRRIFDLGLLDRNLRGGRAYTD